MKDYYEVLGVLKSATPQEIKVAFRGLALKHHPNTNSDPLADGLFKEIVEAYDVLIEESSRRKYDAKSRSRGSYRQQPHRTQDYSKRFKGNDSFNSKQNKDIKIMVVLSPQDLAGVEKILTYSVKHLCESCVNGFPKGVRKKEVCSCITASNNIFEPTSWACETCKGRRGSFLRDGVNRVGVRELF